MKYLNVQLRIISTCRDDLTKHAVNTAVHKTRVAIRRARVAIAMLGPLPHLKGLSRDLKTLGKRLERVGDLDVVVAHAAEVSTDTKRLFRKRKQAAKKLWHSVNVKKRSNYTKRFKRLGYLEREPNPHAVAAFLNKNLISIQTRAGSLSPDEKELHSLRTAMKRTRYLLEASDRPVQEMKRLQTLLGESHDLQVLNDFAGTNAMTTADQRRVTAKARPLIQKTVERAITKLRQLSGDIN